MRLILKLNILFLLVCVLFRHSLQEEQQNSPDLPSSETISEISTTETPSPSHSNSASGNRDGDIAGNGAGDDSEIMAPIKSPHQSKDNKDKDQASDVDSDVTGIESAGDSNLNNEDDKDVDDDDSSWKDESKTQRFNFAAQAAGAVILDKSPNSAKGFNNLLIDDRDKYGISQCSEKKWVVIGLGEDILVESISVANYEKYSSMLKDFQVFASTSYPAESWINMGTYTAMPMLGEQLFNITENSNIHTRVLKVKFLTHYLDEALCTLSQIKVHGMTAISSLKEELERESEDIMNMLDDIDIDTLGGDVDTIVNDLKDNFTDNLEKDGTNFIEPTPSAFQEECKSETLNHMLHGSGASDENLENNSRNTDNDVMQVLDITHSDDTDNNTSSVNEDNDRNSMSNKSSGDTDSSNNNESDGNGQNTMKVESDALRDITVASKKLVEQNKINVNKASDNDDNGILLKPIQQFDEPEKTGSISVHDSIENNEGIIDHTINNESPDMVSRNLENMDEDKREQDTEHQSINIGDNIELKDTPSLSNKHQISEDSQHLDDKENNEPINTKNNKDEGSTEHYSSSVNLDSEVVVSHDKVFDTNLENDTDLNISSKTKATSSKFKDEKFTGGNILCETCGDSEEDSDTEPGSENVLDEESEESGTFFENAAKAVKDMVAPIMPNFGKNDAKDKNLENESSLEIFNEGENTASLDNCTEKDCHLNSTEKKQVNKEPDYVEVLEKEESDSVEILQNKNQKTVDQELSKMLKSKNLSLGSNAQNHSKNNAGNVPKEVFDAKSIREINLTALEDSNGTSLPPELAESVITSSNGTILNQSSSNILLNEVDDSAMVVNCLENLKFNEFQAKMMAKLERAYAAQIPDHDKDLGGKDRNVFRALMNRIKSVEMNHRIIEKFTEQWTDCIRGITKKVLEENELISKQSKLMKSLTAISANSSISTLDIEEELINMLDRFQDNRRSHTVLNSNENNSNSDPFTEGGFSFSLSLYTQFKTILGLIITLLSKGIEWLQRNIDLMEASNHANPITFTDIMNGLERYSSILNSFALLIGVLTMSIFICVLTLVICLQFFMLKSDSFLRR